MIALAYIPKTCSWRTWKNRFLLTKKEKKHSIESKRELVHLGETHTPTPLSFRDWAAPLSRMCRHLHAFARVLGYF